MTKTTTVSLYEAKTQLSNLGDRAANGEEIIVTKHGKPRFKLVPVVARAARPRPGTVDLGVTTSAPDVLTRFDWFAADEELERAFGTRE